MPALVTTAARATPSTSHLVSGIPELSLVCPAYNEVENVPTLVAEWDRALRAVGRPYEIILVDDASTDGTLAAMLSARERFAAVRVLQLRRHAGQSAALAAGFDTARGQWVITSDADLQNEPADVGKLLALADSYDLVCGWRHDRHDNWLRRLISRVSNARRRRKLGDAAHDTGCGLKVFRREVTRRILRFDGMHRFFPALAQIEGFRVTEVKVAHRPRRRGRSKYNLFNRSRKPIQDLRAVAWYRSRRLDCEARECL